LKLNENFPKSTIGFALINTITQANHDLKKKSFWLKIYKLIEEEVQKNKDCAFTICKNHLKKFTIDEPFDLNPFYTTKKELKATSKFLGDAIKTMYKMKNGLSVINEEEEEDAVDGAVDFITLNFPKVQKIVKALDQMITNGFGKRLVTGELKIENNKVFYMEIIHVVYKQLLTLFDL